ncbi:MAG TPA: DUF4129 domain-containing protein [Thermoanaerobaculia bacterium]|nr:DUF4129 domain-containing protein [Thermoanaerobaculia bacterium]
MKRLLAILLIANPLSAMTAREYARSLDRLRSLLASKQIQQAHVEATAMMGADVESGFQVDDTLLRSVIEATTADIKLLSRLALTSAQLRAASTGTVSPADQKLLGELEKQQSAEALKPGGEVFSRELENASIFTRMAQAIEKAFDWIGEKLANFFDWLKKFWPDIKLTKQRPTAGMRWIVGAVVAMIAIIIGVLAFEVIRRSRRRAAEVMVESVPATSARDADPLSRGANEWERHAVQLAAAGRIREAIRAWYHAVLVTLYGNGILTFRKGRTNWEYVSTLTPSIPWRGDFVKLTRRFEHEWYGSANSSPDALSECRGVARGILNQVRRAE